MRFARLLLLLLVAGCSAAPRRGNSVVFASGADLQSPNPLLTVHPLARQVQRYALLTTLVRYDSVLVPEPYLARRWTWSADRTTLTMHLFDGLRWHDGAPTTAQDAAWTLRTAMDSLTGYPRRTEMAAWREVTASDDTTLVIRFGAPQTALPDLLTDLAILPRHLLDSVAPGHLRQAPWNRHPVGNGPFRFVAWQPNRRWIFERNPDFPDSLGGPPRLDRFMIAVVDEPTTKLAGLASGELDFAGINPAHATFVRGNPALRVLDYPLLYGSTLLFNTRRPPFDRLDARRAVAAAIDRTAIVDGILFGFGTPATGPLPPALMTRFPGIAPVDGRREVPPAVPLTFELLTVGSGEAALEQMLQAQLAAHGLRAEIRQLELATYLDRIQGPAHDFDVAVMGLSGDLALGHLARLVSLAGMPAAGSPEGLAVLLDDSLAATYLYHARGVQGINRRVQGVRMDIRGELPTLSRWWIGDTP